MSQCPHPPWKHCEPYILQRHMWFHKSWPPGDAWKCHKADKQEAFTEQCICSYRDMLKDHSTLTPDSPPQQKGPNKKPLYVNKRELPIFQAPCLSLGAAFPFSLINPTLCADFVVSGVNSLACEGKNSWHLPATKQMYLKLLKVKMADLPTLCHVYFTTIKYF
jgi:hypothetical protein